MNKRVSEWRERRQSFVALRIPRGKQRGENKKATRLPRDKQTEANECPHNNRKMRESKSEKKSTLFMWAFSKMRTLHSPPFTILDYIPTADTV